ncbi:hypothetical protein C6P45_000883 [Maudiozyma exigua]|uniref:HIT-type domain-containing protein n=1 Tax=Maudiozyma exigua TaxID=34358 RepID=A0A9P6W5R3_MAUEX|nr:hypothetical protein C6P45_000883 [Kazachstania exigua]
MTDLPVMCEICHEHPFKYKCPGCLKRTCSLDCSKRHKQQENCTGKAYNPQKYVSNDEIKGEDDERHENNALIQRDFHFLTGLKRELEIHKNDAFVKNKKVLRSNYGNYNNNKGKTQYQQGSDGKRTFRRGVNCLLLPRGMSRSSMNRSKWEKSLDLFVWTVEWIICPDKGIANNDNSSNEIFKHLSHRFKETDSVIDGMSNSVFDKCCEMYNLIENDNTSVNTDNIVDEITSQVSEEILKKEKHKNPELLLNHGIKFYIKWFPHNTVQNSDSKELIEIEPTGKCIGVILKNRTVVEFPTIYIARNTSDLPSDLVVIDETTKTDEERGIMKSRYNTSVPTEGTAKSSSSINLDDNESDNDVPLEESAKRPIPASSSSSVAHTQVETTVTKEKKTPVTEIEDEEEDNYDPTVAF